MGSLSRWLDGEGLVTVELTDERVDEFMTARRAARASWSSPDKGSGPARLLEFLGSAGALPEPVRVDPTPVSAQDALLGSFAQYLLGERGLVPVTADGYAKDVRRFLCAPGVAGVQLRDLSARDVTDAIVAESKFRSVAGIQTYVIALRSFLRFCLRAGMIDADLSGAALAVTGRQRSMLPRALSLAHSKAVLGSCDRRSDVGRRDFAMLSVLLRLGLRAGELASLCLDDIDWKAGEVIVRGKGRREERLPLPTDVGEAIAAYLQASRPASLEHREVFLRATAPLSRIGRGAVTQAVYRACVRAGLPRASAHRLRHTMAYDMVRVGVPLPEISQVMRHNNIATTAIYTRVDVEMLRTLARCWPGSGQS